jgi:hypothetical protein
MHCHGTHAQCKNIFFQNMVRTDPYWQQAPLFSPPPSSRGGRKPTLTLKRFSRGNTEQKAKSRDRDLKGTWLTLTVKVTLQCIIRTPVERNQNCSHLSCFHFPFCIPLLLLIFLCFFSFFFLSFSDLSNLI